MTYTGLLDANIIFIAKGGFLSSFPPPSLPYIPERSTVQSE